MRNEELPPLPGIALYSWWKDIKGRIWLINAIWHQPNGEKEVHLLEYGKSEWVAQPYELIQQYIHDLIFKPLII